MERKELLVPLIAFVITFMALAVPTLLVPPAAPQTAAGAKFAPAKALPTAAAPSEPQLVSASAIPPPSPGLEYYHWPSELNSSSSSSGGSSGEPPQFPYDWAENFKLPNFDFSFGDVKFVLHFQTGKATWDPTHEVFVFPFEANLDLEGKLGPVPISGGAVSSGNLYLDENGTLVALALQTDIHVGLAYEVGFSIDIKDVVTLEGKLGVGFHLDGSFFINVTGDTKEFVLRGFKFGPYVYARALAKAKILGKTITFANLDFKAGVDIDIRLPKEGLQGGVFAVFFARLDLSVKMVGGWHWNWAQEKLLKPIQ